MNNKLAEFITKKAEEAISQKLGSAAYLNIAPMGQPALEGEIMVGDDVRIKETMRNSTYDVDKNGVVDNAELAINVPFDLRLHFLIG